MKTTKKILLATLMTVMANAMTFSQTDQAFKEFKQPHKSTEIVVGIITEEYSSGAVYDDWDLEYNAKTRQYEHQYQKTVDTRTTVSEEQMLQKIMTSAKKNYEQQYPKYKIRDFKSSTLKTKQGWCNLGMRNTRIYYYEISASVVITDPKEAANENLSKAIDKALGNVRQGSRVAIDQVTVWEEINRDDYKDQLIDALLGKGYKVVAKEYLEKLYEEQQNQQSGIYNDRTIVQENNFSAVGYYINVKVTKTSIRIQVVNVSTGEYEGNAAINIE